MAESEKIPGYRVHEAQFRDITNAAESLRCLAYLIREEAEDSQAVLRYAQMSDECLSRLWELLRKVRG